MNNQTALLDVRRTTEADRLTVVSGTSEIILMENAGRAVSREIEKRWSVRPVVVLCGPGNNGHDGCVVARQLADAGWCVRVALLGSRDLLSGEARRHADLWPGAIEPLSPEMLEGAELVVDAIFGAGLSRALEGPAAETLAAAAQKGLPVVAIDVPSGVMGDTGESLGAVPCVLTVTFFRKKPGHLLLPGRRLCGEVVVADIGMSPSILDQLSPDMYENDPGLWFSNLPRPQDSGNKYTRGHALIGGGYPVTGASRMAALSAARAGSGLTTIAAPEIALPIYAGALTSIMFQPLSTPENLYHLLEDHRFSAFLIGPGAGVSEATRNHAIAMLRTGRPTILDADAITSFQDDPEALFREISGPCILTPHDGEFARLFDPKGDKLTRTRAAARGGSHRAAGGNPLHLGRFARSAPVAG